MSSERVLTATWQPGWLPAHGDAAPRLRLSVAAWCISLLTAAIWLYVAVDGFSLVLAQCLGGGIFAVLALYLGITLAQRPQEVCRPINLFFIACIYFFILDAAFLLHRVSDFDPASLLEADTLIAAFLLVTVLTHRAITFRTSFLAPAFRGAHRYLSGDKCFIIAVVAVGLECLRRLAFEGFNVSGLWHDLLLGRSGGAFRLGVANDWRVVLTPIQVLFLCTTLFADLAWRRGSTPLKKFLLLIVVAVQLGILVLDTVRGDFLIALLMPTLIRSAQNDRSVGRLLSLLLLSLPLLIPIMNAMNYARGGWQGLEINQHEFQEPGEDDFFWLTNLVAYRSQDPGLLRYKARFGLFEGLGTIGWEWVTSAIPRVLWPNKPGYWEEYDETRGWYAADSVIGDLFRAGGVSSVVAGAALFGLWLSLLDRIYLATRSDGEAIAYVFLALSVVSATRSAAPFNTVPLLLSCLLVIVGWNVSRWAMTPR
jgi:uncharacterized membrane protein (UPF0136 family)